MAQGQVRAVQSQISGTEEVKPQWNTGFGNSEQQYSPYWSWPWPWWWPVGQRLRRRSNNSSRPGLPLPSSQELPTCQPYCPPRQYSRPRQRLALPPLPRSPRRCRQSQTRGYGAGTSTWCNTPDVRQRLAHQSSVLNMNLAPLFNNLIEYNPETPEPGDLRCDLCTSWDLSDDGITYTYNINPDAKWWDGVPVTADDIVFSFESMVSPDQFPAYRGPVHFHPLQHRSVLRFRSG